jgi:hypothetical protein
VSQLLGPNQVRIKALAWRDLKGSTSMVKLSDGISVRGEDLENTTTPALNAAEVTKPNANKHSKSEPWALKYTGPSGEGQSATSILNISALRQGKSVVSAKEQTEEEEEEEEEEETDSAGHRHCRRDRRLRTCMPRCLGCAKLRFKRTSAGGSHCLGYHLEPPEGPIARVRQPLCAPHEGTQPPGVGGVGPRTQVGFAKVP